LQFPVYLWLGPVPLHPHWLFESLAYLIGARVYALLKRRSGDPIDSEDRWWIVAAAFVGAVLGSKVLVLLEHPALTLDHFTEPLELLEGKTVVGGLVGALIAVELAKHRLGISRATGDVFAIPLAVGIAIGRVGCFLTGLEDHTHGLPANLPWAIDYGDGVPRHPAQLYEIAFVGLVLLPILVWLSRRPHREGDLFKFFMVGYLGFRLALEFLKPGEPVLGVTAIQWACLATLGWYAYALARSPRWVWAGG
jgi:phosphatidylglycerol:prolipoprotein diacylglycerol transferase